MWLVVYVQALTTHAIELVTFAIWQDMTGGAREMSGYTYTMTVGAHAKKGCAHNDTRIVYRFFGPTRPGPETRKGPARPDQARPQKIA